MINYIKKDPVFKRAFSMMLLFTILSSILFIFLDNYEIKKIYNEQISVTQEIVGAFIKEYPQDEIKIMDAVFGEQQNENIALGKSIMNKYGYDTGAALKANEAFNNIYKYFMIKSVLKHILLGLVLFTTLFFITRYLAKDIMNFSKAVDRVMNGDSSIRMNDNNEGITAVLKNQFYIMSNRLNMNVEKLNREKENMKAVITDMSHQLKTPVASLKLSNALLLENDVTGDEREEFLQKCNEDIDKLQWLISSLIKMSRLEMEIIDINKQKASIKNTIIKAVNGVYMNALNKNIDIDMEELQDEQIQHDIRWTKEALANIVENAVKYTHTGGSIKITTHQLPSLFRIDIEDNGIGISKEEINKIFKKFYRGKSSEVIDAEGLGVGLYLTRKIIEKQGGSIIAHSTKGRGARFSVLLQKCYES